MPRRLLLVNYKLLTTDPGFIAVTMRCAFSGLMPIQNVHVLCLTHVPVVGNRMAADAYDTALAEYRRLLREDEPSLVLRPYRGSDGGATGLRLSFSNATPERIREGIQRLKRGVAAVTE